MTLVRTAGLVGLSGKRIGWNMFRLFDAVHVSHRSRLSFLRSRCNGCFLLVRCDFEHVVYGKQHRPILILSISERKRENEDTDYSSEINRVNCPRRTASKH